MKIIWMFKTDALKHLISARNEVQLTMLPLTQRKLSLRRVAVEPRHKPPAVAVGSLTLKEIGGNIEARKDAATIVFIRP